MDGAVPIEQNKQTAKSKDNKCLQLPTDREMLEYIYKTYANDFPGQVKPGGKHENDPYLAIDLSRIAEALNCSSYLIFGRLYYGPLHNHGHQDAQGRRTDLFVPHVGGKGPAVNFPLLVSVLADLQAAHHKEKKALLIAVISLVIAGTALLAQFLQRLV